MKEKIPRIDNSQKKHFIINTGNKHQTAKHQKRYDKQKKKACQNTSKTSPCIPNMLLICVGVK